MSPPLTRLLPLVLAGPGACSSCDAGRDPSDGDSAGFECPDSGAVEEGFHVSPDGSATGDGSPDAPWDLATALAQPEAVQPGSVIWLHGGTYAGTFTSRLGGTEDQPITLRGFPGEWAVIDGAGHEETTLSIEGRWTRYQGFEVTNSDPNRWGPRAEGLYVVGPQVSLVNLVLHDLGNNGFWIPAVDLEIYGCIIYNNGYDDSDRAHGHGIYTQNLDGTKIIEDNLVFNGYSYGIHAYTEGGSIQGFRIAGNVWFDSGVAADGTGTLKDNCLVGGLQPAARIELEGNYGWADGPSTRSVRLGYSDPTNQDVTLEDNWFVGTTEFAQPWASVSMTGNTFYGAVEGVDTADFPDNTYLAERPTEPWVFVLPNRWEPGRAHLVVYNWALADTVEVPVDTVLTPGTPYEVFNGQDVLGDPVLTGVFDDHPLSLPMTGLEPAQPVGSPGAIGEGETTGVEFQVFLLVDRCP